VQSFGHLGSVTFILMRCGAHNNSFPFSFIIFISAYKSSYYLLSKNCLETPFHFSALFHNFSFSLFYFFFFFFFYMEGFQFFKHNSSRVNFSKGSMFREGFSWEGKSSNVLKFHFFSFSFILFKFTTHPWPIHRTQNLWYSSSDTLFISTTMHNGYKFFIFFFLSFFLFSLTISFLLLFLYGGVPSFSSPHVPKDEFHELLTWFISSFLPHPQLRLLA